MNQDELLYEIALGLIPGIGSHTTRQLISYCGSAKNVFKTPKGKLLKIPDIGAVLAEAIQNNNVLALAEIEIHKAEKTNTSILFYTNPLYPARLKHFNDSPTLLYFNGNHTLNPAKSIAIIGTRNATTYGREITEKIIEALIPHQPTVVSGLAYGIDVCAHKAALHCGLPTIGVMGSGIDIIYPAQHRETAQKMKEQGGLLTEYSFGTKPEPSHFPARNRIVASLADVVLVVEAAESGGALITAEIANGYNREVFAVPGSLGNKYSEGCNKLIKTHKAHIFTSVKDLEYILNWDLNTKPSKKAYTLPTTLSEDEQRIAELLSQKELLMIDELSRLSNIPINRLSSILLEMEFEGIVKALPGKKFKLAI